VKEFITPEQFAKYEQFGLELVPTCWKRRPLVRSSYKAQKHFINSLFVYLFKSVNQINE
jgi:lipoic acid synthetase